MARGIPGYLRYRVVQRFDAGNSEVTNDLPHLHQSVWSVVGFQPAMPSSSAIGSFTIRLFPPGTKQYKQYNPSIYSKLSRWMRVEAYLGYNATSITLGNLVFAGFITGIKKTYGSSPSYELTGITDVGLANYSRPFPGEFLSNDVDSNILKSYLGTNELGAADNFNPFTAANYTSTALAGGAGTGNWSGTTDDGLNVVSCSAGTNAVLISKAGAAANDRWHTHYIEVTGRLTPSSDTSNAGQVGIGLSNNNTNAAMTGLLGYLTAFKSGSRYSLTCAVAGYSAGSGNPTTQNPLLNNVDDPNGNIPFTIGLLLTLGGNSSGTGNMSLIVNGKVMFSQHINSTDPTTSTRYPWLFYSIPATGSATAYFTNLAQFTRFTTDGPSTAAAFGNGTITASTNKLAFGVDPGPTFLDVWSRIATREGWYWRYTPQAYVVGTRTLGTVDLEADPGVDRTARCIFSRRSGNLVELTLDDNADPLAASTIGSGLSTLDGGGLAYWRDIATLQSIGVIEDQALMLTASDFNVQRQSVRRLISNKTSVGNTGNKTVVVVRDASTADKFRELDKVTIDDPEVGVNMLSARVMVREFTEGSQTETLTLDQFSWHGQELL